MENLRWHLAVSLVLLFLAGCNLRPSTQSDIMPASSPILPITTGTFTQPWSAEVYQDEDWDKEFAAMQAVGIDLWIYQWVGDSKQKNLIYPTKLDGYTQSTTYDMVEMALRKAKQYDCKVFLGLVFNEEWWSKEGSDLEWLLREAGEMKAVAGELYTSYYPRYPETLAGWYINWEMDNFAGYNRKAKHKENIIAALQQVSGYLNELNPDLPSSIAPFFNTAGGLKADEWGSFWYEVLSRTDIDILMLQDGIGVNHVNLDQLPEWYQQVCSQVRAAGKECWSDLENFSMDQEGNFSPAPTERLIRQHQIAAQFVERIVTFSFISYMSPVNPRHAPYYQSYQTYLSTLRQPFSP